MFSDAPKYIKKTHTFNAEILCFILFCLSHINTRMHPMYQTGYHRNRQRSHYHFITQSGHELYMYKICFR